MTRPSDLRPFGGRVINFDKDLIGHRCVKMTFETSQKKNPFVVPYDFVFDAKNNSLKVEIN